MARMAIADLEAAIGAESRCHQRPPEAHTRSFIKPEPAVLTTIPETLQMSELRQRLQTGSSPTTRALNDESSPEISPNLTPTSTAEAHGPKIGKDGVGRTLENLKRQLPLILIVEDSGLLSQVKTVSYSLLTFIKFTTSRKTPEEVEELNKSRGYDKLKYERGEQYGFPLPGSWLTLQIQWMTIPKATHSLPVSPIAMTTLQMFADSADSHTESWHIFRTT